VAQPGRARRLGWRTLRALMRLPFCAPQCLARHLAVVVVGFPATPLLLSRARVCISAAHSREDLAAAVEVLRDVVELLGLRYAGKGNAGATQGQAGSNRCAVEAAVPAKGALLEAAPAPPAEEAVPVAQAVPAAPEATPRRRARRT
jgi:hypothetical protein